MKNSDELRPVCIGDLIELGLIRVNPEADTATGNARYVPTGNNDPVIGQRLENLYLAAQGAQIELPAIKPDADELLRSSGVGRYDTLGLKNTKTTPSDDTTAIAERDKAIYEAAMQAVPDTRPFKVCISVEITRTPDGRFESIVGPAGVDKHQLWGTGGVGDTLAKALIQSVSHFELLEQKTPESFHKDYREILEEIHRASGLGPLPPPFRASDYE